MNEEVKVTDHVGERETRIAKVHKLRTMGVIPYAQSFAKTQSLNKLLEI